MATYKCRGSSHNIIYPYRTESGDTKQQWETYETELEAIQRKAYIDYLQKGKQRDKIREAALDYRARRAQEDAARQAAAQKNTPPITEPVVTSEDNTKRTFREFMERFLPIHARKKHFSPNTYDSYVSNLENHIYPYFGDRIMSTITAEEIDIFIDYLGKKPCKGSKAYRKSTEEIPTLSSATVKKCYNILTVGMQTAKAWHYIREIPATSPPTERTKKRKAWESTQVWDMLESIRADNPMLHLAVHLAFVCSLRAGEVAGISVPTIDFYNRSLWITQIVQRVSAKSLEEIPKGKIIKVFPEKVANSKSRLILKTPKTEGSYRKQYLTTPLLMEIKARIQEIQHNKEFFGPEYQDHGLLICNPDGTPIDPKSFDKDFKDWQRTHNIENMIEFQGLRKSGQMHKIRLTKNNYQLVAENAGQSPEVLMSNYNEALDSEKKMLAMLVETNFYQKNAASDTVSLPIEDLTQENLAGLVQKLQGDPALSQSLLQMLLDNADVTA